MNMLMPVMMLGLVAAMLAPGETQKEEPEEERKLLPAGRGA